ncbi:MAG: hypothetical protein WBB64_00355 [Anaerolineales bacterium]
MRPSLNLLPGETVQRIIDEGFALLENPGIELHNLEGRELLLAAVTRRSFIICQVENSRHLIPSPDSLHKGRSGTDFTNLPAPGNRSGGNYFLLNFQPSIHPSQILPSMLNSSSVTQPIYFPFPAC